MEHKNIPEIRFSGFTNEWEQRKFGDLIKEKREKTKIENEDTLLSCAIDGMFLNSEMFGHFRGTSNVGYLKIKMNDLILSAQNLHLGNANVNMRFDHGIISPAYKVYSLEKVEPNFMNAWLKVGSTKNFFERATTEGASVCRKNILWNDLYKQLLSIPSFSEQQKIGSFFKQLDNTIALHQRKLDLLKEQKKGFLQKMFPKNGETVPELRFSGFTNEWEQRKLGEITKRVTRKNKELESTLPLTISAQYGLVDQITYFDKRIASKDVSNYYLIKKGEFAYNKSYSKDFPWGAVKRLDNYDKGVLSTLYIVFKPTDIESNFLVSYYDTTMWHKEVSIRAAEGARNHGLLNITAKDFFDTDLIISTNSKEQQKIGSFFKQLDDTIALHQRKLELLKEQKKGFLQKMFPKNS